MLKQRIASDFFVYTAATYVTQVLGILTSFAMRYFLEPADMGVREFLDVLLNYGLYSNLGVLTALYTEIPFHIGKGDVAKANEIRDTGFAFTMLGALLTSAAFALWAAFSPAEPGLRIGVAAIALILITTSVYNFYVALMWAGKDFRALSKAIVLNASLYLLLIFLLASRARLSGLLAAVFLSGAVATAYLAWHAKNKPRWSLKPAALWSLLRISAPLVVTGFAYTLFMSTDRLLITRAFGLEALGHYSIALLVTSYANVVPKLLALVVFPNMQEDYGQSGSKTQISHFVTKPARVLAYGLPLFLGTAYLLVPHLVHALLPKYEPGLESMRLSLLGVFFIAMCQPIQTYLTTIYKRWQVLPLVGCGAAVALAVAYALIRGGFGLKGVAAGMSAGFFAYFTALVFYVFSHFASRFETWRFYAESAGCFLYYVLVTLGIDRLVRPFGSGWDAVPQILALIVLCAPLLYRMDRQTGALSVFWAAAVSKMSKKKALQNA